MAACLVMRLTASFGTGLGSHPPPLPHPARRTFHLGSVPFLSGKRQGL